MKCRRVNILIRIDNIRAPVGVCRIRDYGVARNCVQHDPTVPELEVFFHHNFVRRRWRWPDRGDDGRCTEVCALMRARAHIADGIQLALQDAVVLGRSVRGAGGRTNGSRRRSFALLIFAFSTYSHACKRRSACLCVCIHTHTHTYTRRALNDTMSSTSLVFMKALARVRPEMRQPR